MGIIANKKHLRTLKGKEEAKKEKKMELANRKIE